MRQSGNALRKLIRSLAAAGFWSGVANGESQDLASKPLLQHASQDYWDRLLMGPALRRPTASMTIRFVNLSSV
jgi:hypothetical protein